MGDKPGRQLRTLLSPIESTLPADFRLRWGFLVLILCNIDVLRPILGGAENEQNVIKNRRDAARSYPLLECEQGRLHVSRVQITFCRFFQKSRPTFRRLSPISLACPHLALPIKGFYLDEECTTPDGGVVVVDQAMAMELYGFGGSCGKDEARNRNMALGCINGEVQAAYYASTDTKCSGDWIFMDISPSSCRKRPSNGWVPSGSTWDGFVQSICGETYVGANDIASSSPDNSSDPPATAPKRAVSADCAGKSSIAGSDVILLMGQSNMSGRGSGYQESIDGPLNPRIQQWSRDNKIITASEHLEHGDLAADTLTKVGMGTAFGRAYVGNLQAQRKVLLVPTAEGSTALVGAAWSPGGKMFEEAVQRTNAALASDVGNCIAAVLWHQGERDINAGIDQDTYRLAWMDMIATLRTRIPAIAKAPVVLGEFAPAWIASEPELTAPVLAAIRSIPEHVEFTAVVSSAGLSSNYGDIRHFNAVAQRELGKRYFDKLGDAKSNTDRGELSGGIRAFV